MNSKNLRHRIENPSCGYPAASITEFIRGRPGAGRRPAARPRGEILALIGPR